MLTARPGLISLICANYGFLWLVAQEIKISTSYNFELRCGASCIIKQVVSFVTVLNARSVALEVEHVFNQAKILARSTLSASYCTIKSNILTLDFV